MYPVLLLNIKVQEFAVYFSNTPLLSVYHDDQMFK